MVLDGVHQKILQLVFAKMLNSSAFPEEKKFRIDNEPERKQIDHLKNINLLRVENGRLCLTLEGLIAIGSPAAVDLIGRVDRIIPVLKQFYRDTSDGRVTVVEIANKASLSGVETSMALYYFKELSRWANGLWSSLSSGVNGLPESIQLAEGVLDISSVSEAIEKRRIERESQRKSNAVQRVDGSNLKENLHRKNSEDKLMFFIMPFQKHDVEMVWKEVYSPVAKLFGFRPIRIDETDNGDLKLDQIINGIKHADLILADLTHERPNCYYEVGYARRHLEEDQRVNGNKRIIMCARHDHIDPIRWARIQWPRFWVRAAGPKVHFDLSGYDVLEWNLKELKKFETRLCARIEERMSLIPPRESVPEQSDTSAARVEVSIPAPKVQAKDGFISYEQSAAKYIGYSQFGRDLTKEKTIKKNLETSADQYKRGAEKLWPKK